MLATCGSQNFKKVFQSSKISCSCLYLKVLCKWNPNVMAEGHLCCHCLFQYSGLLAFQGSTLRSLSYFSPLVVWLLEPTTTFMVSSFHWPTYQNNPCTMVLNKSIFLSCISLHILNFLFFGLLLEDEGKINQLPLLFSQSNPFLALTLLRERCLCPKVLVISANMTGILIQQCVWL